MCGCNLFNEGYGCGVVSLDFAKLKPVDYKGV
jgi:hypothetical protein